MWHFHRWFYDTILTKRIYGKGMVGLHKIEYRTCHICRKVQVWSGSWGESFWQDCHRYEWLRDTAKHDSHLFICKLGHIHDGTTKEGRAVWIEEHP